MCEGKTTPESVLFCPAFTRGNSVFSVFITTDRLSGLWKGVPTDYYTAAVSLHIISVMILSGCCFWVLGSRRGWAGLLGVLGGDLIVPATTPAPHLTSLGDIYRSCRGNQSLPDCSQFPSIPAFRFLIAYPLAVNKPFSYKSSVLVPFQAAKL